MTLEDLINALNINNLIGWSIKAFGILFSVFYILFAIVILHQIRITEKTVAVSHQYVILMFAFFQIIVGVLLVLFSIFIL